jgi:hypothetical protein
MTKKEIGAAIKEIIDNYNETKKEIDREITEFLEDIKKRSNSGFEETLSRFEERFPEIHQQIVAELKAHTLAYPELFKGPKGDSVRGDDGKSVKVEDIKKMVIKYAKPGKTPVPELDYPSERQVKKMVEKMIAEKMPKDHTKMVKEVMKKLPTAEKMAREMESLPQNKKLDYEKGLKNTPNNSTQYGSGLVRSGGGMGNWEHQVFNTSSATTSITLSRNVAAGGSAILVRYQGQLLAHGVQYTISGKVITFTFTLQDSTFVEVTYVRT